MHLYSEKNKQISLIKKEFITQSYIILLHHISIFLLLNKMNHSFELDSNNTDDTLTFKLCDSISNDDIDQLETLSLYSVSGSFEQSIDLLESPKRYDNKKILKNIFL